MPERNHDDLDNDDDFDRHHGRDRYDGHDDDRIEHVHVRDDDTDGIDTDDDYSTRHVVHARPADVASGIDWRPDGFDPLNDGADDGADA